MMAGMLQRVCFLSVVFAVVSTLTDDDGVSHILKILCTSVLLICVLEPVRQIDFESLALDMAEYRAREEELLKNGEEMSSELNRAVIEEKYASYIEEKAREMGVTTGQVKVKTKWDTAGIWVPQEAYIEVEREGVSCIGLRRTVKAQLGIPEERQTWIEMKR